MRQVFLVLIFITALSACRSTPAVPFDTRSAEYINSTGMGKIEAHAFYRDEKGKIIYAAGENAYLIPVTAYAEQRFFQIYGKAKYAQIRNLPWTDADPEFRKYMRSTKAESNGRFTFDRVAPGEYFIATAISWRPENSFTMRGAALYERVSLTGKESEPVKLVISGK